MSFRSFGRRRGGFRKRPMTVINSIKNVVDVVGALPAGNTIEDIAIATNTPLSTVSTDVSNGCQIKAIHLDISVNGTGVSGVNNRLTGYLWKNPGNNLTTPNPGSTGTSNEKKFIIFEFMQNLRALADGGATFRVFKWQRLPKRYWRMGTDDRWQVIFRLESGGTANYCSKYIYKWYR